MTVLTPERLTEIKRVWEGLNASEKAGVKFGLFPARLSLSHDDVVALMNMAGDTL